jgi:hypothetical protein
VSVQVVLPPQPLETVPQATPWQALLFGVQQLLPSQTCPKEQVFVQVMLPPQPLETVPQATPWHALLFGVQQFPASQTSPDPHTPQLRKAPQLSWMVPQVTPSVWHKLVSTRAVVQAAFSQTSPTGQVPQFSVPPQPLEIVPQAAPCATQVVGVQVLVLRQVPVLLQ